MKTLCALALMVMLPSGVIADGGWDTLKGMVARSDLVVLGQITSQPENMMREAGVSRYLCNFKVEDVLKGDDTRTNTTITVTIIRFEWDKRDRHPLINKEERCILFLEQDGPRWTTADFWFGVQHPFPSLGRSVKHLMKEN